MGETQGPRTHSFLPFEPTSASLGNYKNKKHTSAERSGGINKMQNTWVTERLEDPPSRRPKWLQGTHSDSAEEALARTHTYIPSHTHTHPFSYTHTHTPFLIYTHTHIHTTALPSLSAGHSPCSEPDHTYVTLAHQDPLCLEYSPSPSLPCSKDILSSSFISQLSSR